MKTVKGLFKRALSGFLALVMVVMLIPIVSAVKPEVVADRVVDPSTMNGWAEWFGNSVKHTENAGGVWADKSVFTDASQFPENTVTLDDESNFLVALSAIAANKSIVGYTNIPTDTMLVLDLSGSMVGKIEDLVEATNSAMKALYAVNNHNRVGVVLYSGNSNLGTSNTNTATVILPLDRYTARNANGNFFAYSSRTSGGNTVETISVASNVYGTKKSQAMSGSKQANGGTYIQNGLYKAYQEFANVENTVIESGFQSGMEILPIVVLMSDGAPTSATTNYTDIQTSNAGNGSNNGANTGMAFVTQLTASYIHAKIEEKYNRTPLFYTLGVGVGNSEAAQSVLDPVGATASLWESYSEKDSISVSLPSTNSSGSLTFSSKTINKNSYCTLSDYVNEYYSSEDGEDMVENFQNIVNEIIIQSRYYPTHLQGQNPDFAGYITFEDKIGEYMEVKDIKGILVGDTLFDGAMLASRIVVEGNGSVSLDDPELTKELIGAVCERLGVSETVASELLKNAAKDKQLYYKSNDDYNNCISWYAKADGSFLSFADKDDTAPDDGAVYLNRSYGFLGKSTGNIKDSDMMYMSVQVNTDIASGQQMVYWKIPAALVPMITYSISLKGDSVETATDVKLDIQENDPIRLVFEVGLHSDINELNINSIMASADSKFKTNNGYQFWTNSWQSGEAYVATSVQFHPSTENERYYFIEDTDIYVSDGNGGYDKVTYNNASGFDSNTKYYRMKTVFTQINEETKEAVITQTAEELTAGALAEKMRAEDGTWYIPRGTVSHLLDEYMADKSENRTESLEYLAKPFVELTNSSYDAYTYLGNNGRIQVTPEQGITITKLLENEQPDTNREFKFIVELDAPIGTALANEYRCVLTEIGEYEGEEGMVAVRNGKMTVTVPAGKTMFIVGLPTNTEYTVTESSENLDYELKSVSVNGVSQNEVASGSITAYSFDEVEFVNAPTVKGGLTISKTVTHPFGNSYNVPEDLKFNIAVTLTRNGINVASTEFSAITDKGATTVKSDENGVISLELAHGDDITIHGIPAGTQYTVEEINIPAGFTLTSQSTGLSGAITVDGNATASLVNSYIPNPVTPDIEIDITKLLEGREFKEGDSFEFVLARSSSADALTNLVTVDTVTAIAMKDVVNGKLKAKLDASLERLTQVGTYHYVIYETDASLSGNGIKGVVYDNSILRFDVTVGDRDMDGQLEITAVTPEAPLTVSGNASNGWRISATFHNVYKATLPATVTIDITKYINNNSNAQIGRNGFSFALYDSYGEEIARSNLTDSDGNASITITYPADLIGNIYSYTLKELVHETPIPGMTYSQEEYNFTVEIIDNGDGTVGTLINGSKAGGYVTGFTNTYDPTDAVLIISGVKELSGRVVNENEFSFKLYETGADFSIEGITASYTAFAGYDRSFAFPMFTYSAAGTHYYVITETQGNLGGITYDDTVYTLKVEVVDVSGVLTARTTLLADGKAADEIIFRNEYNATPVKIAIKGTKQLSGRELEAGEFSFKLVDSEGKTIETVQNAANGRFEFAAIEYISAGVYSYTVTEVKGNLGGITYDTSVFYVDITVTDNGYGVLDYSVSYRKGGNSASEIVFVNSYSATPAEVELGGKKTLIGRELIEGEFEFRLTDNSNSQKVQTAYNDANGNYEFEPLVLRAAGEYSYTVTEVNNGHGGVGYDATVYSVNIKVTDNGKGQLVSEVEYLIGDNEAENLDFTNIYRAAEAKVTLVGTKLLDGRELKEGEFEFVLTDAEGNKEIVYNDAEGRFSFSEITYNTVGVYSYTVTETNNGLGGVDYDETVYNVTVTVTDNFVGQLIADIEVSGENGGIVFTNGYSAEPTTAVIAGNKTLNGRNLVENEFAFEIKDNLTGETITVYNSADGRFATDPITFAAEGEYSYTVTEINNGLGGVIYDERVYVAVVKVTDNGEGQLAAEVTYLFNDEEVEEIHFVNTYEAEEYYLTLNGNKELIGRDIKEKEFSFLLYSETEHKELETVFAKLDGGIEFSPVKLERVGKYTFTVTEELGTLGGITYDSGVITVIVTIADDLNGKLYAESIEYIKNEQTAEAIVFTNEYKAEKSTVTLGGVKTLLGRELKEGEFNFNLYETGEDYEITDLTPKTVTNLASGGFEFDTLEYETAGDRYYVITESDGGLKSIVYDTTVYRVKVSVTDNGEGQLISEVTLTKADGGEVDTAVFANVYNALTVKVTLDINKTVESKQEKTIGADGFNFILVYDGIAIKETATDANGKAKFELTFTEEDAGKTYTYFVSEVNRGLAGVTYDKSEYIFAITVDYDSEGYLVATVTKDGSTENAYTADFVNIYEIIEPGDNSNLLLRIALILISGGASISLFMNDRKKRRSF